MAKLAGFNKVITKADDLKNFIDGLKWTGWRPRFIVLHNTGAPNQKQWNDYLARKGNTLLKRLANFESYYRVDQKWKAGPHWFVSQQGWLMGTPSTQRGTHTPSWNAISLGIETVGDFDTDPFDDKTRDNVIHLLACLHGALGIQPEPFQLGVRGLHFHKEDPGTTHKHCPGKHVVKADVVQRVAAAIVALHPGDHPAHAA